MEKSRSEKTPPTNRSNAESSESVHVQTKLKVGSANDKYEREADQTADKVVSSKTQQSTPIAQGITPLAQRKSEEKEEPTQAKLQRQAEEETPGQTKLQRQSDEEEPTQAKLQRQADEEEPTQAKLQRQAEEEEPAQAKLQRKAVEEEPAQAKAQATGNQNVSRQTESKIKSTKGSGSKLSPKAKNLMNARFGADFGEVTIHNDSTSHELSRGLNAQAFTVGKDVYFASGKYDPESEKGKHLLAHELTHTLQQSNALRQKIQKKGGGSKSAYTSQKLPIKRTGNIKSDVRTIYFTMSDMSNKIKTITTWSARVVGFKLRLYGVLHKAPSTNPEQDFLYPINAPIAETKTLSGKSGITATLDPMSIAPYCQTDCDISKSLFQLEIIKTTNTDEGDAFTLEVKEI